MIQRIQTLHLLAATLLAAVMLFVPLAWFGDYGRTVTMYAFDVRSELLSGAEGAGEPAAASDASDASAAETVVAEAAVAAAVAGASAAESTPAEAETASTATAATTEGAAPVEGPVTAEGDVSVERAATAEGVAPAEAAAPAESAAAAATAVPAAGETLFSDPMPPYLGILLVLAAVLPLVTIFLFRRRLLQIRLCAVEMMLLIGAFVMEAVYYFRLKALFADLATTAAHASLKLPMIFPLLALFFVFLASRAVFRDEMLVRAADRIR